MSPPMWGCGLKCPFCVQSAKVVYVTPYVGVWIEIGKDDKEMKCVVGHPLCGGVD